MSEIERTQQRTRGYWYCDDIAELVGGVALALVGIPLLASARTGIEMLSTISLMAMILLFPASAHARFSLPVPIIMEEDLAYDAVQRALAASHGNAHVGGRNEARAQHLNLCLVEQPRDYHPHRWAVCIELRIDPRQSDLALCYLGVGVATIV